MLKKLIHGEEAQGLTEYILIIALIAVVCVASLRLFGSQIKDLIVRSTRKIKDETSGFSE
ncbi:MAG: Flp family type IVb pilin [Elusimicrobia bacterium HGW-Elusimicrobia-1]|jgi:Flp pilus assembly pilin Flp|nr:MAG: Flp family type IVb pilin [Elusimicrobia bacterium HGW-Elusimicrobia-1]